MWHILEGFRPVIPAALQENDACLVAVSGDGTLSITDLRKMKVSSCKPCRGMGHSVRRAIWIWETHYQLPISLDC